MKEDFVQGCEELRSMGVSVLRISNDFYQQPKRQGVHYFVKSPAGKDKTWSCALYPQTDTFHDFSNNCHGDVIGFYAYTHGCSQWESLQILRDFYGLSDSREHGKQEVRRRIPEQEVRERKRRKRQQEFQKALSDEINFQKKRQYLYKELSEKVSPLSDVWAICMDEVQNAEYVLDILCASDTATYRFMKMGSEHIPSDKPQQMLDVMDVLRKAGRFFATQDELMLIEKRRDSELMKVSKLKGRHDIG